MMGYIWQSFSLRTKGLLVALIPLIALLLSSIVFFTLQKEEQQAQAEVIRSLDFEDKINLAQTQLEESETRLRGYLLGGSRLLLRKSYSTQDDLRATIKELSNLATGNSVQSEIINRMEGVAAEHIAESRKTVANFRTLSRNGQLNANIETSRVALDTIRDQLNTLRESEETLRENQIERIYHARFRVGVVITTGALIGALGGLIASVLFTLGLDSRITRLNKQAHALAEGQPLPESTSFGNDAISSLERELHKTSALLIERQSSLYDTNEQLNHLVTSMPGVLTRLDKNFRILYVSPNASRVFGYEEEEILGDPSFYSRTLHPDDRNRIMVSLTRAMLEKTSLVELERRVKQKSGEYRWLRSYMRSEYDEKGNIISLLSYSVDVTELKQTQQALHESETLFRNSFDFAPIGIVLMTPEGKWLKVNRAMSSLLGYTQEEFMQTSLQQITHPDDYEACVQLRNEVIQGNTSFLESERRYLHRDGHIVWVQIHISLVRDTEGQPLYFIGQIQNITERKRMDVELAQARDAALESARAKADFMANMSHEIRTPMNGIFGMIGLLANTRLETTQRDFIDTMRESAEALLVIINDILDFSKIEAGKLEIENSNFDLNTTVESSIGLLAVKSRARGIELSSIIQPEVPTLLRGDSGRLRQVLLNLLDNAIKFTPDGGNAMLSVEKVEENENSLVLNFSIADSGIGIDEEKQSRLFQPFAQADSSTTRRFGGTGLGLAICKQLVELMGGKIGLRSIKGQGSTFWFTVRLEKQSNSKAIAAREKPDMSKCRVLIIDSNDTHRHVIQQQVASWNFSSDSVRGGNEALKLLQSEANRGNPYHIVLINRQLEEMDALTLVSTIRAQTSISQARIIIMVQPEDNTQEIYRAGADNLLTKPIRQSQLFNCLSEVLEPTKGTVTEPILENTIHSSPESFSPLHILVAEDNLVNQKVVLNQLKNLGHSAVVVNTGIEAVRAWQQNRFDVILMDCHMPEMDGYAAAREIRALEDSDHHIPIIALTANALTGDRELCIAAGMDDYLPKPVNQTDLDKMLLKMSFNQDTTITVLSNLPSSPLQSERLAHLQSELPYDLFQDLVKIFLEEVPQLISELHQAWSDRDVFQTGEIAHKLKGSCATLGAARLSHLCQEIQSDAEANKLDAIPALLVRVEEEFEPIKVGLSKYLPDVQGGVN